MPYLLHVLYFKDYLTKVIKTWPLISNRTIARSLLEVKFMYKMAINLSEIKFFSNPCTCIQQPIHLLFRVCRHHRKSYSRFVFFDSRLTNARRKNSFIEQSATKFNSVFI